MSSTCESNGATRKSLSAAELFGSDQEWIPKEVDLLDCGDIGTHRDGRSAPSVRAINQAASYWPMVRRGQ